MDGFLEHRSEAVGGTLSGCLLRARIEKGPEAIAVGFFLSQLHYVNEYITSLPELAVALGFWARGLLVLTALFKIAVGVKEEVGG